MWDSALSQSTSFTISHISSWESCFRTLNIFSSIYRRGRTSTTFNQVARHPAKRWLVFIHQQKNPVNGIFKNGNRKIGESVLYSDFSLVTVAVLFYLSRPRVQISNCQSVCAPKSGTCMEYGARRFRREGLGTRQGRGMHSIVVYTAWSRKNTCRK